MRLRLGLGLTAAEQDEVDKGLWIWRATPHGGPIIAAPIDRADLTRAESNAERERLLEEYARAIEAERRADPRWASELS
jgi:hypothetical protein